MAEQNLTPFNNALKEKMPFGYFYNVQSIEIKPRGLEIASGDYTVITNLNIWRNNKDFLRLLVDKRGVDLIEEFEVQLFSYYQKIDTISAERQAEEISRWFYSTEKVLKISPFLLEGFDNKYAIYGFDKWSKSKRNSIELPLKNVKINTAEQNSSNSSKNLQPKKENILYAKSYETQLDNFDSSDSKREEEDKIQREFIISTIECHLNPFSEIIQAPSYICLTDSLTKYFTSGSFPKTIHEIKVGKVVNLQHKVD